MKIKNIVILLCIMVSTACDNQTNSSRQKVAKQIRMYSGESGYSFNNVQQLGKQLELPPVDFGFDSLQIRIWFNYSLARKKHLIIIQPQNDEWKGSLYEISIQYVDTLEYDQVKDYDKKDIEPISGWEKLINTLNELKIRELSDTSASGADGSSFCVEILTSTKYTYYDFWEPEYTNGTNWQKDNMIRILATLEREFKFKMLSGARHVLDNVR